MRKLRKRNKIKLSKGISFCRNYAEYVASEFDHKIYYSGYGFFNGWMIYICPEY